MKRIVAGLLTVCMSFTLFGCTSNQQGSETVETPPQAVVTCVAALKGPTAMGIVSMMETDANSDAPQYEVALYTAADEIVPLIGKGEVDIALIPTNLAATLYQKTEGGVQVIDVNAGSVLYGVSGGGAITSAADLADKTVYMTGKGTTPEWTLRYLIEKAGLSFDEMQIEFKSESTEIVSLLQANPDAVGILPQPFATVAAQSDERLEIVYCLSDEWQTHSDPSVQQGTATGVTIVRKAFAEEHPEAVAQFIEAHAQSVQYMTENPEEGAALVEQNGIAKAGPVKLVLEAYNPLTAVSGDSMKAWLEEYLGMLYEIAPEAVGGAMPDEGFYYLG